MFNFNGKTASLIARRPLVSVTAVKRNDFRDVGKWPFNRLFSVTWLAAVQISWNKRKFPHEFNCPRIVSGTPTWPPFYCFILQYGYRDVMWKRSLAGWLLNTGSVNTGLTVVVFNMDRCVLAFKKKRYIFSILVILPLWRRAIFQPSYLDSRLSTNKNQEKKTGEKRKF